jgi:NAD(P)-dependent dehydrogenase (short-subunit alcohol dehydrogenase family)
MVIDDQMGVGSALTEKLRDQGCNVALVRCNATVEETEGYCYSLKTCSAEAITKIVEDIRQDNGPLGGLVYLLPLKQRTPFEGIDMAGWRERLQSEAGTLFLLLKSLERDLNEAANQGKACVVAVTGMGGGFATDLGPGKTGFFPGQGAVTGLLKTVDIEWPEVRVKAIDLNLEEPVSDLADHILAEAGTDDGIVEVGYDGSRRLRLGLVRSPVDDRAETLLEIDSSWVILVTGGARGITAEVTRELAGRYHPTLILAGRSPLPPERESEDTSGLSQPSELKAALIARMQRHGKSFALADVEAAYRQLCKDREIRSNLAAMRSAGAKVEYFQVDVRDEHGFGSLIDDIYRTYNRLDGVIHGAGIIEDKLLKDKTLESFDRVLGTKAESTFVLTRKLRAESLRFLVLFSSVAGRFGNRGQCDYTAANEVVNKMAVYLNRQWPGRVVSINWGPWDKSGMVSAELQEEFARRGVRLIPPAEGSRMLDMEITRGHKDEVEVVIGDGPWGCIEQ